MSVRSATSRPSYETGMTGDRRRTLLTAALGFLQIWEQPPEVAPLRRWLDSWTGVGIVVEGMARHGFVVALARPGDAEPT